MERENFNNLYIAKSVWGEVSHLAGLLAEKKESLLRKRVVICEEKFTLSVEKELARRLGGIMTTRVLSFGKICDTLKAKEKYLSKTSEVMLLSKLITSLEDELELFSCAASRPSLANSIYEILSLMSSSHVDFAQLEKKQLPAALQKKISDICKINKAYQAAKDGLFLDATDKMEALYQNFDSVELLKSAEIFIVGHTSFTNQMLAVISKMVSKNKVSVYMLEDSNHSAIISALKNSTSDFEITTIQDGFSPLQAAVYGAICGEMETIKDAALPQTRVFATDSFEVENIALKIKQLLQGGVLPCDISLVLANFESDLEKFSREFEKYKIPYFAAKSKTLEEFPFPQYILLAIDLAISNYSQDSVRRALKSPFSPLSLEDSFRLENFIIARNIDRGRFFKDEIFQKGGFLQLRDEFLQSTQIFPNQVLTATEFAAVIEKYTESCTDTLALLNCSLAGHAGLDSADFLALSLKKTLEVLAEMKAVLEDEVFTLENLKNIFEGGLCGKEIAIIPAQVHAIEITDTAGCLISTSKHLFLTGACKSFFPSSQKDTALLSDKDILTLSLGEINISPSVEFLNENQTILCKTALLSGVESLHISYSEICGGEKETESEFFGALCGISPAIFPKSEYHFPLEICGYTLEETLASEHKTIAAAKALLLGTIFDKANAVSVFAREHIKENTLAKEISSAIYSAFERIGEQSILDAIAAKSHIEYVSGGLSRKEFSPSHIERYFACPYSCFLAQNMRLSDREVGVLKEFDTGNFLHYLLEEFSQKMHAIQKENISPEVERIAAEIEKTPAFAKFAEQEKFQFVLKRLKQEADKICHHIYKTNEISNFKPTFHEFTFGGDQPVETSGGLALRGKVDRVDIFSDECVVVDYKTGYIDLSEGAFYHGLKLQSELYLFAVSHLTGKNPRGCVYLPISDNFGSSELSYKMKGKLALDDTFLKNLDTTLQSEKSSEIYPISINQNGSYSKTGNSLLEEDAFKKHIECAVKTAEQGKKELDMGYIFPSPYVDGGKDSCKYCRFVSICKSCGENNMRGGKVSGEGEE